MILGGARHIGGRADKSYRNQLIKRTNNRLYIHWTAQDQKRKNNKGQTWYWSGLPNPTPGISGSCMWLFQHWSQLLCRRLFHEYIEHREHEELVWPVLYRHCVRGKLAFSCCLFCRDPEISSNEMCIECHAVKPAQILLAALLETLKLTILLKELKKNADHTGYTCVNKEYAQRVLCITKGVFPYRVWFTQNQSSNKHWEIDKT